MIDRTQLGGSFIRLQSDGCWGWSHLEGYLTHKSGDSCWLLAKTSPRAIYIWLLHVAWAFSQHGGWILGGNVPIPGRSYMIYFQKSYGIFSAIVIGEPRLKKRRRRHLHVHPQAHFLMGGMLSVIL